MCILDFINGMIDAKVGNKRVKGVKIGNKEYTFHSWRLPYMADVVSGKTAKITLPSAPLSVQGYDNCFYNNEYLVCSGPYRLQELNSYDNESAAEDYSWSIDIFTAGLYVYKNDTLYDTLYKCDTRVKTTWNSSGEPSYQILSVNETIKKTSFTFPSDFGWILSYGGSQQQMHGLGSNLDMQVDDFEISKKPYHLESLKATDDLKNSYVLVSSFPDNFENTLYPSGPNTSLEYTLYEEDYWNEQTYESAYERLYAVCYGTYNGYDPSTYEPIYVAPYYMTIVNDRGGYQTTIGYKEFNKVPTYWNKTIIIGGENVSLKLSHLNTSSPLFQYVKKVVWD